MTEQTPRSGAGSGLSGHAIAFSWPLGIIERLK